MCEITPLPMVKGMIARTLVQVDGCKYEVYTCNTKESVGPETAEFWDELLKNYPYETAVYKAVPATKPLSDKESEFLDIIAITPALRRDFDLGDLYVSRSDSEESAALEHDLVIEQFKSGDILLFTKAEREAIYGADQLLQ